MDEDNVTYIGSPAHGAQGVEARYPAIVAELENRHARAKALEIVFGAYGIMPVKEAIERAKIVYTFIVSGE